MLPMILRSSLLAVAGCALFSAAQADQVSLTDLTGRHIELAAPADRIVAFPVPMASAVVALDGGVGRLVALHPEAKTAIEDGVLGEFFPEALALPSNILADGAERGRTPDLEVLRNLDPHLVVQWDHAGADAQSLIDAGFPTALIVFGDEAYIRGAITLLGDAIGKPDKVEMLLNWRDETSAAINAGLEGITEADKPKVAYFFYALTDLQTEGSGTYANWQIDHVGGINAAAGLDGWGTVRVEEVAAWNPDVILLGSFERGLHVDRILSDPALAETSAVKNKRVYKMPLGGYRWEPAGHESPLTWMWLADLLYPDRFDFNLRAEVTEWYPKLYGHTPTEDQIDRILQTEMNGKMAGYGVFGAR